MLPILSLSNLGVSLAELSCKEHAHMSNGTCACDEGWTTFIPKPNTTTTTDSCPCPDLCNYAGTGGRKCPEGSTCIQKTCNMMACNCSDSQVYDRIKNVCVGESST